MRCRNRTSSTTTPALRSSVVQAYPKDVNNYDVDYLHFNAGNEDDDDACQRWILLTKMMALSNPEINEDDKMFMNMWNWYIFKCKITADCQLREVCRQFVKEQGQWIVKKNLFCCFVLHVVNLFEFNLVQASDVRYTIQSLQDIRAKV